jgi:hypothetical protein
VHIDRDEDGQPAAKVEDKGNDLESSGHLSLLSQIFWLPHDGFVSLDIKCGKDYNLRFEYGECLFELLSFQPLAGHEVTTMSKEKKAQSGSSSVEKQGSDRRGFLRKSIVGAAAGASGLIGAESFAQEGGGQYPMQTSALTMVKETHHFQTLSRHAELQNITKLQLIKSLELADGGQSLRLSAQALQDMRSVYVKLLVGANPYASLLPGNFSAIGDAKALTIACCCCPCCCASAVEPSRAIA